MEEGRVDRIPVIYLRKIYRKSIEHLLNGEGVSPLSPTVSDVSNISEKPWVTPPSAANIRPPTSSTPNGDRNGSGRPEPTPEIVWVLSPCCLCCWGAVVTIIAVVSVFPLLCPCPCRALTCRMRSLMHWHAGSTGSASGAAGSTGADGLTPQCAQSQSPCVLMQIVAHWRAGSTGNAPGPARVNRGRCPNTSIRTEHETQTHCLLLSNSESLGGITLKSKEHQEKTQCIQRVLWPVTGP